MDRAAGEAEQFAQVALDGAPLAVGFVNQAGCYTYANRAIKELTGFSSRELLAMRLLDLVCADDREKADQAVSQLLAHGAMKVGLRLRRRDGGIVKVIIDSARLSDNTFCVFHIEATQGNRSGEDPPQSESTLRTVIENSSELVLRCLSHPTTHITAGGTPQGVHNSLRDITVHREALDDLAKVMAFNESILNTSPDLIYVYDIDEKRNVYSNDRVREILGYSAEEIQAMGESLIPSLMHPDDFPTYVSQILPRYATAKDQETIEHRYRMRHKGGDWRWLNSKERIFRRAPDGRPRHIFGMTTDITERQNAEEELEKRRQDLARSEEKYRLLFENMQPAFALHQIIENEEGEPIDYVFLEANPAFGTMTGLDVRSIIGRRVTQVIPGIEQDSGDWITRYGKVAKDGGSLTFEQFSESLNKWYQVLAYRPTPGQFATLFQDVTERKNLEQRLHQSEKMQAIGQLAGGIAHDFNNQLAAIVGNADLLRQDLTDQRDLAFLADNILLAGKRAAELTGQLLAFARKGKYQVISVDLHKVISEVTSLLRHTIDRRITIRQRLDAPHPYSNGDPSQLQNALMNLALNARDAMPSGGEMEIATAAVELAPADCSRNILDLSPGSYLRVSIRDTGCGMDAPTRARMFEPFFTTKEMGKGTGMGLAAVYGTVKNHGGGLQVESEPGKGTRVDLFLPIAVETTIEVNESKPVLANALSASVLVVDDEAVVLEMCAAMLKKMGCNPIPCPGGREAVSVYEQRHREVDLVLLDLVMPELDGVATFRRLKAINPAVRVILSSGFSLENNTQAIQDEGALGFIQKPFRYDDLSRLVHEVLSAPGAIRTKPQDP